MQQSNRKGSDDSKRNHSEGGWQGSVGRGAGRGGQRIRGGRAIASRGRGSVDTGRAQGAARANMPRHPGGGRGAYRGGQWRGRGQARGKFRGGSDGGRGRSGFQSPDRGQPPNGPMGRGHNQAMPPAPPAQRTPQKQAGRWNNQATPPRPPAQRTPQSQTGPGNQQRNQKSHSSSKQRPSNNKHQSYDKGYNDARGRASRQRSGGKLMEGGRDLGGKGGKDGKKPRRNAFDDHLDWGEVARGFKQQTMFQGKLRINARCRRLAYVSIEEGIFPCDMIIEGDRDRNRALDGDVVIVEVFPTEEWEPLDRKKKEEEQDGAEAKDEDKKGPGVTAEVKGEACHKQAEVNDNKLADQLEGLGLDKENDLLALNELDVALTKDDDAAMEINTDASDLSDVAKQDAQGWQREIHSDSEEALTEARNIADEESGNCSILPEGNGSEDKEEDTNIDPEIVLDELENADDKDIVEEGVEALVVDDSEMFQRLSPDSIRPWENDQVQDSLWKPRIQIAQPDDENAEDILKKFCPLGKEAFLKKLQPKAKVVQIVEKKKEEDVMGMLSPFPQVLKEGVPIPNSNAFVMFTPADMRIPRMLIPRMEVPESYLKDPWAYQSHVFLARKKRHWSSKMRNPLGERVRCLGEAGELNTETEALESEFGVDHGDFPPEVMNSLKCFIPDTEQNKEGAFVTSSGWKIPQKEYTARRDFRQHRIFSIDPTTAKDLDDALHVQQLEDGTVEIGVHIADVSYFVRENTDLDKEAQRRATTIYLVQKVTPMLPPLLCEELCSLNPGVERLAYSVVWWMNPDGTMTEKEPWYGRSIIKSCCKLDYDTAQLMIDGTIQPEQADIPDDVWDPLRRPPGGVEAWTGVVNDVRLLNSVAQGRRRIRFGHGALALNSVKLCFKLDDNGNPVEFFTYPIKDSNKLVEEYMLLANYLVAQQLIVRAGGKALIRMHPPPLERGIKEFLRLCDVYGHTVDISSAGALQASLSDIMDRTDDPFVPEVLIALATRPMKPAQYIAAGQQEQHTWRHYALNIPYYTHFTSPIRRYADVMVHRLLTATLSGNKDAVDKFYIRSREIEEICLHCNEKKMMSKRAQERSDEVFFAVFLKDHPLMEEGIVIGIGEKSFTVLVPRLGVEARIYVDDLEETKTKWNQETQTLEIENSESTKFPWDHISISLFSKLKVHCTTRTRRRIEIRLELVGLLEGEPTFHLREVGC